MKYQQKIRIFNARTGLTEDVFKIRKTSAEWRNILNSEQYRITRQKGTENPVIRQGAPADTSEKIIYRCACCGTDLFVSGAKFESGTGWPSFREPVSGLNLIMQPDHSCGMLRMEVLCARCDAHLGHVFDDGPPPAGKRYCINSVALKPLKVEEKPKTIERAAFGAGCFWGVEACLRQVGGVLKTCVGFMGGTLENPAYEDVCSNDTGHAEVVYLEFDRTKISYEKLLDIFWHIHDPTSLNRQGPDTGEQYRSVIFYYTEEQRKAALLSGKMLEKSGKLNNSIVTQIVPAQVFYPAEEYHQRYYEKRGLEPACRLKDKLREEGA